MSAETLEIAVALVVKTWWIWLSIVAVFVATGIIERKRA